MNNRSLKKLLAITAFLCCCISARAQMGGYNYLPFGVGAGISSTRAYTNLYEYNENRAYNVNIAYNYSPYLPVALEFQMGKLSGGSIVKDPYKRQFENGYKALLLHADVQLGEYINYGYSWVLNIVKNFYLGTGVGVISNHMNFIQRTDLTNPGYVFPGRDNSINFIVPLRFGYEFKIFDYYDEPKILIDLGYQHNVDFGEGLDGYDDPTSKFKNNALSQYRQITIGVKYNFGNPAAYNKSIRRF